MGAEFSHGQDSLRDFGGTHEEIFPLADERAAIKLPVLLIDELEGPNVVIRAHEEDVKMMVQNTQTNVKTVNDLLSVEGAERARMMQVLREHDEVNRFGKPGMPRPEHGFPDIARALYRLSPAEIQHFGDLFSQGGDITITPQTVDAVWDSGEADGRLALNTPENLEKLIKIADASCALNIIENTAFSGTLLTGCMAYGNQDQFNRAVNLYGWLLMVAHNTDVGRLLQVGAQSEGSREAVQLGLEVAERDGLDPVVRENLRRHAIGHQAVVERSSVEAHLWVSLLLGRQYRMNDGQPVDINSQTFNARLFDDIQYSTELTPEAKNQARDEVVAAAQELAKIAYANQVAKYMGGIQIPQPELFGSNEIKRRELESARAALVRGEADGDGVDIIIGRSKESARQYISDIEFIRSFITRNDDLIDAKIDLETAATDTARAISFIDAALNEPGGKRSETLINMLYDKEIPDIRHVGRLVESLKGDWTTVEHLVRNYWPEGATEVERLRQLLFMSREAIEATMEAPAEEQQAEEADDIKPLESHAPLAEIAEQLDEIILPPRATKEDVKQVVEASGLSSEAAAGIDWDRLFTLVRLRELNGGVMYRSKEGDLGNAPPYFVVVIQAAGNTYAVAESPVEGNATYVVSEKLCPGTWLEVLALSKEDARAVGARRVIHRGEKSGDYHLEKVQNTLFDLMTIDA